MKSFFFVSLFCSSLLFAQSDNDRSVWDGSGGHLLQVNILGETAVYDHLPIGGAFSLRSGLSIALSHREDKGEDGSSGSRYLGNPEYRYQNRMDQMNNSQSLGISALLCRRLTESEYATVLVGAGPLFQYMQQHNQWNERDDTDTSYAFHSNMGQSSDRGIGAMLIVSVRSHIAGRISLTAEYELEGTYRWKKSMSSYFVRSNTDGSSYGYWNESENRSTGWQFNWNALRVGLIFAL